MIQIIEDDKDLRRAKNEANRMNAWLGRIKRGMRAHPEFRIERPMSADDVAAELIMLLEKIAEYEGDYKNGSVNLMLKFAGVNHYAILSMKPPSPFNGEKVCTGNLCNTDTFVADGVVWTVYTCRGCGAKIASVGGGIHWWNYRMREEQEANDNKENSGRIEVS